ncbi:MAG: hypothetical protein HYR85_01295 [Planctomycetes bacterium]|nr:hypothetical protein [Planctomycetota bacterium]MBI3843148.1 hypothetical protein [Planctomycetota bacterium]
MDPGIEIEVFWFDDDVLELLVRASSSGFAGRTALYASHDAPQTMAAAIRGFPVSGSDRREFQLGTFDPKYAGGGCRFVFLCADTAGHAFVHVTIHSDYDAARAEFAIAIEAQGVAEFVDQLERMSVVEGALARLNSPP